MNSSTPSPVIVVGASLVGLSAALSLSAQNIPSIVLERRAAISKHPRAMGYTARTMEIFRFLGIADQMPKIPEDFHLLRARVESLAGKWFESTSWSDTNTEAPKPKNPPTKKQDRPKFSASSGAAMPQDKLELILETAAVARGVDLRRGHTLQDIREDESGVTATVLNGAGEEIVLRGSYLIAADGGKSLVREKLGIARSGRGHMQTMRSVLFRPPTSIEELMKGVHQFSIDQPGLQAFMTTYMDGRWVLMFHDDVERDEGALQAAIRAAIGKKDIPIEIITTGRWELAALVAERFQSAGGKIFLAGDAAHALPPNRGGYGANTGIADVDNLAWKIAAVLKGESKPELLDTYDMERRPVALLRHDQIFVRADYKVHRGEAVGSGGKLDDDAMEFGQIYVSPAIFGEQDGLPAAKRPDEWRGQPGTRVPYFEVSVDGKTVSISDLVDGRGWTLVSTQEQWARAVDEVNSRSSTKLKLVRLMQSSDIETFQEKMGVAATGAVLIRPDGYIAWRAVEMSSEPAVALDEVVGQVAYSA